MGGVIAVPGHEPWFVSNWGFRTLMSRVEKASTAELGRQIARQSVASHGLSLALLSKTESEVMMSLIPPAAVELRREILADPTRDAYDEEFAELLSSLINMLDAYGAQGTP